MSTRSLFVAIIVCSSLSVLSGLQFTLDVSRSASDAHCGILKCMEGQASDQSGPLMSISTMKIFKTIGPSFSNKGNIFATLTQQEPSIDRVSDGVKVHGVLYAKNATIQLEMKKMEDCFAYYTCEVLSLDRQGREIVHSSSLRQMASNIKSQTESGSVASGIALQQVFLLQQLDTKLALLESSLGTKLGALEMRFDTVREHLEDKIESLQDKFQSFKDSVEDKIENKVVEKLCQLDTKLSSMEAKLAQNDKTGQYDSTLTTNLQHGQEQILSGISSAAGLIGNLLNNARNLQEDLTTVVDSQQKDRDTFGNLTGEVQETIESNQKFCKQASSDLRQLKNHVQNISQASASHIHESEDILSLIHQTFNASMSIGSVLQDTIDDIVYPNTCTKGMFSILLNTKFPYPVVRPNARGILDVPYLCDTDTSGGGWIVIQRRSTGNTNFYRDWETYKQGFGALDDDFWLGNDNIHKITSSAKYELRVDIKFDGKAYYAHYTSFSISDEENVYALTLNGYSGTAGDALDHERGRPFSTYDKDNDAYQTNCAEKFKGAWWYGNCHNSNLNGKWGEREGKGPRWIYTSGSEAVTFTEMKIRRVEQ